MDRGQQKRMGHRTQEGREGARGPGWKRQGMDSSRKLLEETQLCQHSTALLASSPCTERIRVVCSLRAYGLCCCEVGVRDPHRVALRGSRQVRPRPGQCGLRLWLLPELGQAHTQGRAKRDRSLSQPCTLSRTHQPALPSSVSCAVKNRNSCQFCGWCSVAMVTYHQA